MGMATLFLILLMADAPRADVHRVEVRVTDPSGFELPGVTVMLERDGFTVTRVTDVSGLAVFENVPSAAYTVRAELAGFELTTKRLALTSNTQLGFKMKLAEVEILFHCGLVGPPSEFPVTVFTRNVLDLLPLQ